MVHPQLFFYTIKYFISSLLTDLGLATNNAQNFINSLAILPDGFSCVIYDLLAYRGGIGDIQTAQVNELLYVVLLIDLIKHLPSYVVVNLLEHVLILLVLYPIGLVLRVVVFLIHRSVQFRPLLLILLGQKLAFLAHLVLRDHLEAILRGLHRLERGHHS